MSPSTLRLLDLDFLFASSTVFVDAKLTSDSCILVSFLDLSFAVPSLLLRVKLLLLLGLLFTTRLEDEPAEPCLADA